MLVQYPESMDVLLVFSREVIQFLHCQVLDILRQVSPEILLETHIIRFVMEKCILFFVKSTFTDRKQLCDRKKFQMFLKK